MAYRVHSIFYTLQGEGAQTGRPAVFCRFAGCNLWSGREQDRATAACQFCDTDFAGTDGPDGGSYATATALAQAILHHWPGEGRPLIVCTGGEPLLQLNDALVTALHDAGFEIAIETNGTLLPPAGIDWICVSPKAGASLVLRSGHELKLVFPQQDLDPTQLATLDFQHFILQPMDGPALAENTRLAMEYCLAHPRWRLGLQAHKILGIP
ncbi:MAG: 7-carboxy-7-deazaguanine synthase [Armatimonadota bacterium]